MPEQPNLAPCYKYLHRRYIVLVITLECPARIATWNDLHFFEAIFFARFLIYLHKHIPILLLHYKN